MYPLVAGPTPAVPGRGAAPTLCPMPPVPARVPPRPSPPPHPNVPSPASAAGAVVRSTRRLAALGALLAGALLLALSGVAGAQAGATVEVVQVDGPLDGRIVAHVDAALERAAEQGSEVVVLELDTEGGLRHDGVDLAERIAASPVPVAVWVGPPGARAGGAGALVAHAGHVLATSPASVLGPAVPLDLAGEPDGGEGALLADYAEARGLDAELAGSLAEGRAVVTVPDGGEVAFDPDALPYHTEGEPLVLDVDEVADAGAAAFAASELPDVLFALDGREVSVADGEGGRATRVLDLDPVTAQVRFDNLGLLDQVLHAMGDPTLAYVLLIGGALAVAFELFQPGFGVAGVAGALVLAAGLYGLWVLPVAWWALLLLAAGLALLAVDLAIAGLGVPSAAGAVGVGVGSWWLFDGPPPLQASPWALGIGIVATVLFFVVLMTIVLRTQGEQEMAGAEAVVGSTGVVRSMLNPAGHVFVDGALWRARAPEGVGKVKTGTQVRVTGVDHEATSLAVELVEEPSQTAAR